MAARHEMILNGSAESGAEEWVCPSCGRRMLLRWPPQYEKIVLEHGDDSVVHVGAKGGLRVGQTVVAPASAGDVPNADRQWLLDRQWLRDNGIDWNDLSA